MLLLGLDEVIHIQRLASCLVCSKSVGNPRWIETSSRGYTCAKQLSGSYKVSLRLLDTQKEELRHVEQYRADRKGQSSGSWRA